MDGGHDQVEPIEQLVGVVELAIRPDLELAAVEQPEALRARLRRSATFRLLRLEPRVEAPDERALLRHAVGLPLDGLARETAAAGVMMLPIARHGTLIEVRGREDALAVPGVVGLEITIPPGRELVPLPEGDRYLGFLFARGDDPAGVEATLREAAACIDMVVT